MKKLITLTLALFISALSFAQVATKENAEEFVGTTLTVRDLSDNMKDWGYGNMMTKPGSVGNRYGEPSEKSKYNTRYEDLVGKSFTVENIVKESIYTFLVLSNEDMVENLYFQISYGTWYFDVTDLPEDFYCKKIYRKEDKFDKTQSITSTPISEGRYLSAYVFDDGSFFLSVNVFTTSIGKHAKGVKLLFEDGTILDFPNAETKPETPSKGSKLWRYRSFIPINKKEQEILSTKRITDVQLYIYTRENMDFDYTNTFKNYMKCLMEINL